MQAIRAGWAGLALLAAGCIDIVDIVDGDRDHADTDPFAAGDPATLMGRIELTWELYDDPATDWWVAGHTFEPGSFGWTGSLLVPATGFDSCQVRDGDPEWDFEPASAGAIYLYSDAGDIPLLHPSESWYEADLDSAELDPRGVTWDVEGEGDAFAYFDLPGAITFPTGTFAVTAPVPGGTVAAGSPLLFTWTGDAADRVEIRLSGGGIDVRCLAVDDGEFEVPADALDLVAPGPLSYGVKRLNIAGHPVDGDAWIELRAEQVEAGVLTLAP